MPGHRVSSAKVEAGGPRISRWFCVSVDQNGPSVVRHGRWKSSSSRVSPAPEASAGLLLIHGLTSLAGASPAFPATSRPPSASPGVGPGGAQLRGGAHQLHLEATHGTQVEGERQMLPPLGPCWPPHSVFFPGRLTEILGSAPDSEATSLHDAFGPMPGINPFSVSLVRFLLP